MDKHKYFNLFRDIAIIGLSVLIALNLVESGAISKVVGYSHNLGFLGSFVAGIFFTSAFTAAPAAVALFEIAKEVPVILVALLGGAGAVIGDILIFKLVRDFLSEDIMNLITRKGRARFKAALRFSYLRWLMTIIGGLIIASPFPDELGLMLMGFSKIRSGYFILLSFVFNFAGILILGYFAR